jgi:hypothetical protein
MATFSEINDAALTLPQSVYWHGLNITFYKIGFAGGLLERGSTSFVLSVGLIKYTLDTLDIVRDNRYGLKVIWHGSMPTAEITDMVMVPEGGTFVYTVSFNWGTGYSYFLDLPEGTHVLTTSAVSHSYIRREETDTVDASTRLPPYSEMSTSFMPEPF